MKFKFIQKPIEINNSKDLNECTALKQITDPKSGTPNTANSSMSGSNKFIGARGKLNPKSQIYKASTSKSAVMNETKVFNNFIPQGKPAFPQMNMHGNFGQYQRLNKPMFNPQVEQKTSGEGGYYKTNMQLQSDQKDSGQNQMTQSSQKFSSDTRIHPQK